MSEQLGFGARLAGLTIRLRIVIVAVILAASVAFGYLGTKAELATKFEDLQPADHPYIQTNNQYKEAFGGANVVTVMLTVEDGTIFRKEVLDLISALQSGLQQIDGVNQFQIISLASKKLKSVQASTEGFTAEPLMWPDVPETEAEIAALRQAAIANPLVYGSYISRDLKAALVTVDFIDRLVDYEKIYPQIQALLAENQLPGVSYSVVGQPVLVGTVIERLPETATIGGFILLSIGAILFLSTGTIRGTLLPLVAAASAGTWAVGMTEVLDINFDPLAIVIIFLIGARSISHAIQMCLRYDVEYAELSESGDTDLGARARLAASTTLGHMFRPGILGILTDAGAMIVVALAPIPLLQKAAIIGVVWLGATVICALVLMPLLLSTTRPGNPRAAETAPLSPVFRGIISGIIPLIRGRIAGIFVLVGVLVVLVGTGLLALNLKIGDANPGSPIFWPSADYNRDDAAINARFPGSDRMFLVVDGDERDVMKDPEVLRRIAKFQTFIEAQPEVGGTLSLVDVIRPVNMILREGNPRFLKVGGDRAVNAELIFMALAGSDPGDIDRFVDEQYQHGAVQMQFRDHKGDTIRTALLAIEEFEAENPIPGARFQLAGGLIGVLAAVNEVILSSQIQSIALAILILYLCCVVVYRSTQAGLFFLPVVVISNTVTFGYMAWAGIGLNINSLPVAALGIGLGVDYAFYVADRVREEFIKRGDHMEAIEAGLRSAGHGVLITALTITASMLLWYVFSSLRFQAEMGLLITLWMTVSAISALVVIPTMLRIFKPDFVFARVETVEAIDGAPALDRPAATPAKAARRPAAVPATARAAPSTRMPAGGVDV